MASHIKLFRPPTHPPPMSPPTWNLFVFVRGWCNVTPSDSSKDGLVRSTCQKSAPRLDLNFALQSIESMRGTNQLRGQAAWWHARFHICPELWCRQRGGGEKGGGGGAVKTLWENGVMWSFRSVIDLLIRTEAV